MEAARDWMQSRFVEPFELEGRPLFRFDLVQVADGDFFWLMQYHHLIVDGWGIALLKRSLARIYTALRQGLPPDLQSPSYLAFVQDDLEYARSADHADHRAYWLEQYATVPEPSVTPRTPGPAVAASDCHPIHLSRELFARLDLLAKRYQASTFHVLLGALTVRFGLMQGRDDWVVGLPVSNRPNAAFKNTAGLFAGINPARFRISAEASFGELLRTIRQTLKANHRRQRLPIFEINRAVKPVAQHRQIYDIGLSYERHDHDEAFDTIPTHTELLLHGHDGIPLMLYVRDFHAETDVKWDFVANRACFSAADIELLQKQLLHLLHTALAQPDVPLSKWPLLMPEERRQLIVDWNRTAADFPEDRRLHHLVEAQVRRSPTAVAVEMEGRRLTYVELDRRANRLARQLRSLGVGPNVLVGICMERSLEMPVGVLGILKAGGAYVPLDPDLPPERLAMLLEDAGVQVLVTGPGSSASLPPHDARTVHVSLDDDAGDDTDPQVAGSPTDLAYMIYTSGSTGRPKGALNHHRGIVNRIHWMQQRFGFSGTDAMLLKAAFGFDASVPEFFMPLTTGARLVVARPNGHRDPAYLVDLIQRQGITVIIFVPSMLGMFLDHPGASECKSLRHVICGGETLSPGLVRRFLSRMECELHNFYGPAEAAVDSTCWTCRRDAPADVIPIGRPIANTQCYILDARLEPVPVGVPGELHIGGVQVGYGYHRQEALTTRVFIPDPFSSQAGARLYKTGDLCRYLPDGNIEYLGRIDHQVKIRGFRIELGEIEATLARHPGVQEVVVIAREDAPGDRRLVAYLVPRPGGSTLTHAEIRAFLLPTLPDYMIPAASVFLDILPLTPNGKVDRRALPAPDPGTAGDRTFNPPMGEIEITLAQFWAEALKLDSIGRHDSFFDLGGHSLKAIQLVADLRERGVADLSVGMIFESPTPASMAERLCVDAPVSIDNDGSIQKPCRFVIRQPPRPMAAPEVVPIDELLRKQAQFLKPWKGRRRTPDSFIVTLNESGTRQGLFWCLQGYEELAQLALHLGPDQPVHGMRSGHLIIDYRDEEVASLARYYAAEVAALQPEGPILLGGNCGGGWIARHIALELQKLGRTVSLLFLMEQWSFPPYDGPVALIFGRGSHFNPYKSGIDPESVFRQAYPAGFTVDMIDGAHGQFFSKSNVPSLASALKCRLPA